MRRSREELQKKLKLEAEKNSKERFEKEIRDQMRNDAENEIVVEHEDEIQKLVQDGEVNVELEDVSGCL